MNSRNEGSSQPAGVPVLVKGCVTWNQSPRCSEPVSFSVKWELERPFLAALLGDE